MSKIGFKIKIQRDRMHLTQVQLGELLHVSDKTVSKWEKDRSHPSYELLEKMSTIFDVKIDYFLSDDENKTKFKDEFIKVLSFIKRNYPKIIFTILFIFLAIYFINTYDTLEMYEIKSVDEVIKFDSGYLVKSKNKIIISINNINYNSPDKDIINQKAILYLLDDNNRIELYESTEFDDILYKDFIGYQITRSMAKQIDNNLYLEIESLHKDHTITKDSIKLLLKLAISSDTILYNDKLSMDLEFELPTEYKIDEFILLDNGFVNVDDTYAYYKNINNTTIYFDIKAQKMYYDIRQKNNVKKYDYFYNKQELSYILKNNNQETLKFVYSDQEKNLKCFLGDCKDYLKIYNDAEAMFTKVYSILSES